MSLAPRVTVTLGSARFDAHTARVSASLTLLPGVGSARIFLPAGAQLAAAPGDTAVVQLDSGEGEADVLSGTIHTIRRGPLQTTVSIADGGAALGAFRPAATYEDANTSDVIRALASDAGVEVGQVDAGFSLSYYTAHQGRTAAEHVAYLASLAGQLAFFDAENSLTVREPPSGPPDLALRYGREILAYDDSGSVPPASVQVVIGSGPAGTAGAPNALIPTFEHLPASAPEAGVSARWRPAPVLTTPDGASTASEAATAVAIALAGRVRITAFLLPAVRPGLLLEVQELPDGLRQGPWLVTKVQHSVSPTRGATTVVHGRGLGRAGLLEALLGEALSAAGGLL